jgi:glycosyltransferase involved in cell wall biosynthesis
MPAAMFMGLFERFVDKRVTRFATALICVSQATRSALLGSRWIDAAAVRIRVIHNSMSVGQISRVETLLDMRATVHAKPDEYLIGVAGRVSPYKGQEDMIFALARMSQVEQQQIRLIFVGSGDPPEELDRLMRVASSLGVGERVHFLGYVSGRSVDIISQLDMLAVTTRSFEGFGLTLIEAMSVGVPVLATKVGAIPEFIHDDIGVLVSPCAPAELAIALSDFLAHPESWKQRAKLAMQRQSKEDMAREYRQLFVECLA